MTKFSALISQISQAINKLFGKKVVDKQGSQHKDAGSSLLHGKGNTKDLRGTIYCYLIGFAIGFPIGWYLGKGIYYLIHFVSRNNINPPITPVIIPIYILSLFSGF